MSIISSTSRSNFSSYTALIPRYLQRLNFSFHVCRYFTDNSVRITDVSLRDGLQNENKMIPLTSKLHLLQKLVSTGLTSIEAGSFVSPKWVPQMIDSDKILNHILKNLENNKSQAKYSFLVPNLRGLSIALSQIQLSSPNTDVTPPIEINIFASATETFSQKNLNCSVRESIERARPVVKAARAANLRVRAYISMVLGCPYDGLVSPATVAALALDFLEMGVSEIALGDTTGMGTKPTTLKLLSTLRTAGVVNQKLSMHLHDTYGMAMINLILGLEHGIRSFDGSVAGLGGCPYSPGATGNVATEDLVYLCNTLGLETHIDLNELAKVGEWACHTVCKANGSKVGHALAQKMK